MLDSERATRAESEEKVMDEFTGRALIYALVWGGFIAAGALGVNIVKSRLEPGSRLRRILLWPHGDSSR